ncbi:MAG: hypothetical protein ACQKBU_08215, partial [Verrucomicrobiales bacterium]
AVTALWTKQNFEILGPRVDLELSRLTGIALSQAAFWVERFFVFAATSLEQPERAMSLIGSAVEGADAERLGAFFALISWVRRVVLVVDDLEGVYGEPEWGRRLATFLLGLRHEAPRMDLVVSVNEDVWRSAFFPALSSGLRDRLSEVSVGLTPLDDDEVRALLRSRGVEEVKGLLEGLKLAPEDRYARRVLRLAEDWIDAQRRVVGES